MKTALATPRDWWDKLDERWHFTLDAAADHEHFMCTPYFHEGMNSLLQDWKGVVWCSPPWTEPQLHSWVQKAYSQAHKQSSVVVMLLPVRPRSQWWPEFVPYARYLWFITGDLAFVPFDPEIKLVSVEPQCLLVFDQMRQWTGCEVGVYPSTVE